MKRFNYIVSGLLSLSILAASLGATFYRQEIQDWWFLRSYNPPQQIIQLADAAGMNAQGRRLFYLQNPQLKDKQTFRQFCSIAESSIVLGCYVDTEGIYILDVTDKRLEGVKQVTAAHEMLHAAYQRLDTVERERVDAMTETAYRASTNSRLKEMVENYRLRDPGVVANELHSIIATEVDTIASELETYYSQYFSNRKQIVAFAQDYEAVFIAQQENIDKLSRQIDLLQEKLVVLKSSIDQQEASLVTEAQRLESLRGQGDASAFNTSVEAYNRAVAAYQADIASYNQQVQTLNDLIAQYNDVANEQKGLVDAIDSRDL